MVKRLDMHADAFAEVRQAQVGEPDMTAHRQVRAIQLQREAGLMNRFVLGLHRVGQRGDVSLGCFVMAIGQDPEMTPGEAALMNAPRRRPR